MTHIAPSSPSAPARFGFVVSKAVGNSVVRHRVQRRLRAIAAEGIREGLNGAEVVVRARSAAATAPFAELRTELLAQLGVIAQREVRA